MQYFAEKPWHSCWCHWKPSAQTSRQNKHASFPLKHCTGAVISVITRSVSGFNAVPHRWNAATHIWTHVRSWHAYLLQAAAALKRCFRWCLSNKIVVYHPHFGNIKSHNTSMEMWQTHIQYVLQAQNVNIPNVHIKFRTVFLHPFIKVTLCNYFTTNILKSV